MTASTPIDYSDRDYNAAVTGSRRCSPGPAAARHAQRLPYATRRYYDMRLTNMTSDAVILS